MGTYLSFCTSCQSLCSEKDKKATYTFCHFGFYQSNFLIIMSKKYNLLPGASHFQPFSWGKDSHLQYSYTRTNMYCRNTVNIGDSVFTFVEMRLLEVEERQRLDAMACDDFIAPMQLFAKLPDDGRAHQELEEQFYIFRLAATANSELWGKLNNLDSESEEREDVQALRDHNDEEQNDARNKIEVIIDEFNRLSGYSPKSGAIQRLPT